MTRSAKSTDMASHRASATQSRRSRRIEDAIEAIRAGRMIIVVDDEDRENEGDLTIAAEKVTPEAINFMARYGRGLICLSMTPERLDELEIPLMVTQNTSRFDTAFCVPIEAKDRTTHRHLGRRSRRDGAGGDRSARRGRPIWRGPGHMFPLRARDRRRAGARRPDRSGGRSRADRRAVSGRRHLRNHERGRHDGARAGADEVREAARAADDHDRGPDPVPDAHRVARASASRRRSCRPSTATSASSRSRTRSTARRTSRWSCGEIGDGKDVLVRVHSQCLTGDVLPFDALRLRRAARRGDGADRRRKGAACCCI